MAQNALIIGGAGFLGRAVMKQLLALELGYDVYLFDNESVKPAEEPKGQKEFYHGDACSYDDMRQIIMRVKPRLIIWLAARQGYDPDWANYSHTNVCSGHVLFEIMQEFPAFRPGRIVLASSQAIYGPAVGVKESGEKSPPSVYGLTKLQQETVFHFYGALLGIPIYALRYSIILGPGQSMQSTESGLLRHWYRAWKGGGHPEIYGDGEQVRDFVYVDDAARATALTAVKPLSKKRVFNVGGIAQKIYQMAEIFQEVTGCKKPQVTGREIRPGGEYSLTSSSALIGRELGWEPQVTPKHQIKGFIEFQESMEDSSS